MAEVRIYPMGQAPPKWHGFFWVDVEHSANLIFEQEPEEFIQWALGYDLERAAFLVACAAVDLYDAGFDEQDRYNRLVLAAIEQWPSLPWSSIPDWADEFYTKMWSLVAQYVNLIAQYVNHVFYVANDGWVVAAARTRLNRLVLARLEMQARQAKGEIFGRIAKAFIVGVGEK